MGSMGCGPLGRRFDPASESALADPTAVAPTGGSHHHSFEAPFKFPPDLPVLALAAAVEEHTAPVVHAEDQYHRRLPRPFRAVLYQMLQIIYVKYLYITCRNDSLSKKLFSKFFPFSLP